MADYDLGTAHGRIVIDNDSRGANSAIASFAKLELAAQKLESSFANAERAMQKFTQNVESVSRSSANAGRDTDRLGGSVQNLGSRLSSVAGNARQSAQELQQLGSRAVEANNKFDSLRETIGKLGSTTGQISLLAGQFVNLDGIISKLPKWQQDVVKLSGSLSALASTGRLVGTLGTKLGSVVAGSAAFGLISPRLTTAARAFRGFGGAIALLAPRLFAASGGISAFGARLGLTGTALLGFGSGITRALRGVSSMVIGVGLMSRGLAGLAQTAKIAAIGLAAVSAAAAGMSLLGTIVLGAVSAVKQLSGAALLLPGIFLGFGIAVGTAKLAFSGMKDAFKATSKDGAEFEKAIKDLSPTMQEIARTAKGLKPSFDNLKNAAQSATFAGLNQQIKVLAGTYMPLLTQGVTQVGGGLNKIKNGFVDFLAQPATVKDINSAFGNTSAILGNVSRAVWPLLAAFRDIASVGLEVFAGLTAGAGTAAKRFGDFISEARKTGQLKQWILDGIQGFKDLGSTVLNVGRGLKTIFEAFGASGDNALARLAAGAERFANAMKQSGQSGGLKTFADFAKRISTNSLDAFKVALQQVLKVMQSLSGFSSELSSSFSGGLITAFQALGAAANLLAAGLSKIPGLGSFIGSLLAMGFALKGLAFLFTPIVRGFQLMVGAALAISGLVKTIIGLRAAMTAAAASGGILAAVMGKLDAAGRAALTANVLVATLVAAAAVFLSVKSGLNNLSEGYKLMADSADIGSNAVKGFSKAFIEANGVMGKGVFDETVTQVDNLKTHLDELAAKSPGFKESVADLRFNLDPTRFGVFHTSEFQALQVASDNAKAASASFAKLGITTKETAQAISGSQGDWQNLHDRLAALGEDGVKAIDSIFPLREAFVKTEIAMSKVVPGGAALTNALKTIGDAGSSAADKLNALKDALSALGLIQKTTEQAAFDYQEALRKMGEQASSTADATKELGPGLLTASGLLDSTKQNAFNLNQAIGDLADKFLDAASKGGNANQMWTDLQPTLQSLADAFHLPVEKVQELIQRMGVVPSAITTVMSLVGADDVKTNVAAVLIEASRLDGKPIDVVVNSQTAIDALTAFGAKVTRFDNETHTATLSIDPAQALPGLAALQRTAATPVTVPLTTKVIPGAASATTAANQANPQAAAAQTPAQLPAALPPPATKIPDPIIPPAAQLPEALPPPATKIPDPIPPAPVPITVKPPDQITIPAPKAPDAVNITANPQPAIDAINSVNQALSDSAGKWNDYVNAIKNAFSGAASAASDAVNAILSVLNNGASQATASGQALGQGFATGILSKVDAARAAALALAEAAAAPLPRSPAKIGPFSGTGWTPFRGAALALGFADGIGSGVGAARDQTLNLAKIVSDALKSVNLSLDIPTLSVGPNGLRINRFVRDQSKDDATLANDRVARKVAADNAARTASTSTTGSKSTGKLSDSSTVDKFIKNMDSAQFAMGGFNQSLVDCSGFVSSVANVATGRAAFSERASTVNMRAFLQARGFQEGVGGAGDLRVGWWDNGGGDQGHTALTTASGVNAESTTGGVRFGSGAAGANDAQFTQHMFLPMSKAQQPTTDAILANTTATEQGNADVAAAVDKTTEVNIDQIKARNGELAAAIATAQNAGSSDEAVISALTTIDENIQNGSADQKSALQAVEDAVVEDRGLKKLDQATASTDPGGDVLKIAQAVVGLFDTIDTGFTQLKTVGDLLVRGISGTKDVTTLIDGIQSIASTVSSVISTVSEVIQTAASLAALATIAIPGIGQVAAVASALTGGISTVNAIVDLTQEVFKIAGRFVGTFLSGLAGGASGPLMGDVKFLLDFNDNTLKTWSSDNPDDKRIHPFGPSVSNNSSTGIQQMNIYAGPGASADEIMSSAMFAVRANSVGAGAYG